MQGSSRTAKIFKDYNDRQGLQGSSRNEQGSTRIIEDSATAIFEDKTSNKQEKPSLDVPNV